ncbi:MAG: hypothetical protein NZ988_06510 [Thaumarchaeota archaeon]|nr:hypothetical protein [Candidatus Calditenuaceae archaeon]MDW8187671.1 hypothetical protein [Nitrososphaerota archaeon]
MASASVIVEGIALVAAVIAASSLASVVLNNFSMLEDVQRGLLKELRDKAMTRLIVMAVVYDEPDQVLRVYLKNVGRKSIPVSELTGASVLLTSIQSSEIYVHDRSPRRGAWKLEYPSTELMRGGNAELTVYLKSQLETGEYSLTLFLTNGFSVETKFSVV